jgi:release factor glutamine methyltransferase
MSPVRPAITAGRALTAARRRLEGASVESAPVEARRLLAVALEVDVHEVVMERHRPLSLDQERRLARLVERRTAGEPLQHIEGTAAFRDLVLRCDGRALIPRPETEQLADLIDGWARSRCGSERRREAPSPLSTVLDIGTGSGAIALALLSERTAARALGLDVSADALALARENRRLTGLEDRFELAACGPDPYAGLERGLRFEVIVSNPPYVRDSELARLQPEVRWHEPRIALSGGADGLAVIRRIVRGARGRLEPGGALFLEVGAGQGSPVAELLAGAGPWSAVTVRADLAGRDRFVVAEI